MDFSGNSTQIDRAILLVFKIGDVKTLGRCCAILRRFASLIPMMSTMPSPPPPPPPRQCRELEIYYGSAKFESKIQIQILSPEMIPGCCVKMKQKEYCVRVKEREWSSFSVSEK